MGQRLAQIVDENEAAISKITVDPDTLEPLSQNDSHESLHRMLATSIYKTRDCRFYHVHGQCMHQAVSQPNIVGIKPKVTSADVDDVSW